MIFEEFWRGIQNLFGQPVNWTEEGAIGARGEEPWVPLVANKYDFLQLKGIANTKYVKESSEELRLWSETGAQCARGRWKPKLDGMSLFGSMTRDRKSRI